LELIPQLQQLRLILLNPAPGFCQDPVWCVPGDQFAVCEANLRREVAPRNVHVRRIFILKEHQELESAETPCGANELGSGAPAGEAKGRGQGAAKRR
jgi:hypothetical protein